MIISVPDHYSAFPERLVTSKHDLLNFHMSHEYERLHPCWILCLEDGTNLLSSETTWNEHAKMWKEGDTFLPVIEAFATTCFIFPRDTNNSIQVLRPPRPAHFFSFSRFVTSISDTQSIAIWRYSVFGYFFEDMRMTWHIYPEGTTECLLEPRSASIVL